MLDMYVEGECLRESPEAAGVPILRMGTMTPSPGGAANVAMNAAAIGSQVTLLGGVGGEDPEGQILGGLLERHEPGLVRMMLSRQGGVRTTTKARYTDSGRHLLRVDAETVIPLTKGEETEVWKVFEMTFASAEIVVISDYAKGFITDWLARSIINHAAQFRVPVIVDAKEVAKPCWNGAAVIKPNLREIAKALDMPHEPKTDEEAADAARMLERRLERVSVLLTRGARGMTFSCQDQVQHFTAFPVTAVDVTGAGDTVAAALAVGMSATKDLTRAIMFANAAAAVAVQKHGTHPVTMREIDAIASAHGNDDWGQGATMALASVTGRLH
jgi:D-beta-D-heptose 7-phosphate kinase/D-beta-D-heptose 1-phosphate adenosyltransferase